MGIFNHMNSVKIGLLSLVLLVLGILIGLQIAASPLLPSYGSDQSPAADPPVAAERDQAVDEADDQGEQKVGQDDQQPAAEVTELSHDWLERILANLDAEQRRQILADAEVFHSFVEQEATNRSIKAAALANDLQQNADVQLLMARAGDSVLREMYINRLMQEQLPADFPTDEQVRQFYDNNTERFRTPERVQVWQVFLEVADDAGAEQAAAIEQQARDLLGRIRNNDLTMAAAAVEHSAHKPSRRNDGYMGAVQTGELKPAIAEVLQDLDEDAYGLAHSEDGWHILKKGRTLAAASQPYEDVRQQARQLLINQARQEFRQAVSQEARKEYAYMPGDDRVEQWRQELKSASNSPE